jgi:DNA-binding NtrC family response regulator
MPTMRAPTSTIPQSIAALVVDPDPESRSQFAQALIRAGFAVVAVNGFHPARQLIAEKPPAVLVTALKLREYNGLHLVLRARDAAPHTAALVTSADPTIDIKKEICGAGAAYVLQPVADEDVVACTFRVLFRGSASEPVEPPFERRAAERRKAGIVSPDRRTADRRRTIDTLLQTVQFG